MSIQLVTYANQTVTPTNDAIIYEKAIDQNGIFYGCNVTVTSNNVNITGGYGIVCGREFVINSESIAVTLAPSGTLEGRLYVRLDLADADAPIQLLTATGNTLPALVQDDDVNYTNGVYEMELATFTVGVSSLSDVVETFEVIRGMVEIINYEKDNWKQAFDVSSSETGTFPDEAKEILIIVYSSSGTKYLASGFAYIPAIADQTVWDLSGYYFSAADNGLINVNVSNSGKSFSVRNVRRGGADVKAGSKLMGFYK